MFSLSSASKAHNLPAPALMLMILSSMSSLPLDAGPAEIPAHTASCTFGHSHWICAQLFLSTKTVYVPRFLSLSLHLFQPSPKQWMQQFRAAGSALAKLSPDFSTNKTTCSYY